MLASIAGKASSGSASRADALAELKSEMPEKAVRQTRAQIAKARTRDSMQALAKPTTVADGRRKIISDPPLVVGGSRLGREEPA